MAQQINHVQLDRASAQIADWWALGVMDLNRLAAPLLGLRQNGWVRRGNERGIIGNVVYGAVAESLGDELRALSETAKAILARSRGAEWMRAVSLYHIRFENIHPLHDGNGRIGRLILAAQINAATGIRRDVLMKALFDRRVDYRSAVRQPTPSRMQFSMLIKLLVEITGRPVCWSEADPEERFQPLRKSEGIPACKDK